MKRLIYLCSLSALMTCEQPAIEVPSIEVEVTECDTFTYTIII
jgi:hypothetical protein